MIDWTRTDVGSGVIVTEEGVTYRGRRRSKWVSSIVRSSRHALDWLENELSRWDWSDSSQYASWKWTKED